MVKLQRNIQLSKRRRYLIKTTKHEGAFAVSGERTVYKEDISRIQDMITEEFKTMNHWILEKGGITGHIKAFVSAKNNSVMISTTGDEVYCHMQRSDKKDNGITVSVAAIVYHVSKLELEEQMIALFDSLLEP